MAIAFDAVSDGSGATSGDKFSITHTASGSNRIAIIGIAIHDSNDANRPVVAVTYDSESCTKIDSEDTGSGTSERAELWYIVDPNTTSGATVEVETTGSCANVSIGCITLTGVAQSGQPDAYNSANGSSDDSEASVTTVADQCWVVDAMASEPNITSEDEDGTLRWEEEPETYRTGAGATSGPHSDSTSVTHGYAHAYGGRWRMVIASFEPAGVSNLEVNVGDDIDVSEDITSNAQDDFYEINVDDDVDVSENVQPGGNAVEFDGSTQYGILPNFTSLDGLTNYTMEGWFYQASDGVAYQTAMDIGDEVPGYFSELKTDSGSPSTAANFYTAFDSQSADGYTSTAVFDTGTWVHVAQTFSTSDNKTRIYKNGTEASYTLQNTGASTQNSSNGLDFNIAFDSPGSNPNWKGAIGGYIRVWNIARSQTQIDNNKNYILDPDSETGLIINLNFSEHQGTTLDNDASDGDDLTLYGTPSWGIGPGGLESKGFLGINVGDDIEVSENLDLSTSLQTINTSDDVEVSENIDLFISQLIVSVSDDVEVSESVSASSFDDVFFVNVSGDVEVDSVVSNVQLDHLEISVSDDIEVSEEATVQKEGGNLNIDLSDGVEVAEEDNKALWFDGIDDYVEITDNDDYSIPTTGELSVSFWMRPDVINFPDTSGTDQYVNFIGKSQTGSPNTEEWQFRVTNQAGPYPYRISVYVLNAEGGYGESCYVQESFDPGEWIHIVGTMTIYQSNIYKNGVHKADWNYQTEGTKATATAVLTDGVVTDVTIDEAGTGYTDTPRINFYGGSPDDRARATVVLSGGSVSEINIIDGGSGYESVPDTPIGMYPENTSANLRFGHNEDESDPNWFLGAIRDVRIWNRELSSSEASDVYSGSPPSTGLVGHWKLDESSGIIAHDEVGTQDGSLISSPVWIGSSVTLSNFNINVSDDVEVSENLQLDSGGDRIIDVYDNIEASDEINPIYDEVEVSESTTEDLPFGEIDESDNIAVSENITIKQPLQEASTGSDIEVSDSISMHITYGETEYDINTGDDVEISEQVNATKDYYELGKSDNISVSESISAITLRGWYTPTEEKFAWTDTSDASTTWTDTSEAMTIWN